MDRKGGASTGSKGKWKERVVHLPLSFLSGWFRSCVRTRTFLSSHWNLGEVFLFLKNIIVIFSPASLRCNWQNRIARYVKYTLWWRMHAFCKTHLPLLNEREHPLSHLFIFVFFFFCFVCFLLGERHLNATLLAKFSYMIQVINYTHHILHT